MRDGETPLFFPEPEFPDATAPGWGAIDMPAWLGSSTLPAAHRAREFLNRSLYALPPDAAGNLCRRLRGEPPFDRVFFELLVGRFLQVLGAEVAHQPAGLDGKNVDWQATFPNGQVVYVEATSPDYNRLARRERARRAALLAIIEVELPSGWWIAPVQLPRAGLSQRAFRAAIRSMFSSLPDGSGHSIANRLRLEAPMTHGPFVAEFWPGNPKKSKIASVSMGANYDDSSVRIELAARRKRGQLRAFPGEVVLLAIDAPFDGPDIESFDDALFGHMVVSIDPESVEVTDYSFRPETAPSPPSGPPSAPASWRSAAFICSGLAIRSSTATRATPARFPTRFLRCASGTSKEGLSGTCRPAGPGSPTASASPRRRTSSPLGCSS
jgi:hypothetical protein